MIIPEARFLRHTYMKNKKDAEMASKNEYVRVAGKIAGMLRTPQNHAAGTLSCFLKEKEYPVMAADPSSEVLQAIVHLFESAGYGVSSEYRDDGVIISTDWRTVRPAAT